MAHKNQGVLRMYEWEAVQCVKAMCGKGYGGMAEEFERRTGHKVSRHAFRDFCAKRGVLGAKLPPYRTNGSKRIDQQNRRFRKKGEQNE